MALRSVLKGETITLAMRFYDNGVLYDPVSVSNVVVYNAATGGSIVTTVTPTRQSIGLWEATWAVPSGQASGTYYDQWTYRAVTDLSEEVFRANFVVSGTLTLVPSGETQTLELRLQTIESNIEKLALAANNLSTKTQVKQWQLLWQKTLQELQEQLDTHEAKTSH